VDAKQREKFNPEKVSLEVYTSTAEKFNLKINGFFPLVNSA
jgi:hypothetical protein